VVHHVASLSGINFDSVTSFFLTVSRLFFGFIHPVLIIPDWMIQKLLEQRCPSQSTCERQVTFRGLFYVVDKLRSAEPALLPLGLAVVGSPANLSAKCLKVTLALSPLFLKDKRYIIG
jgi:hypothetical protein